MISPTTKIPAFNSEQSARLNEKKKKKTILGTSKTGISLDAHNTFVDVPLKAVHHVNNNVFLT